MIEQRVGWGQTEQLITTKVYDAAGRLTSETAPGLAATTHTYNISLPSTPANPTTPSNTHTATRPDGGTIIESKYIDGRVVSRTGTAVVAQFFTYGAETDGRRWTRTDVGTLSSPRWQKSWKDLLGREKLTVRPGFGTQANLVAENFYNDAPGSSSTGHLITTTKPGLAPTRYVYDALGRVIRSGLDVNNSTALELASTDRINESDQFFELYNGAWWSHAETRTYAPGAGAPFITSVKRQRLTGHTAGRIDEVRSTDSEGNTTTTTTEVNRVAASATITTTTTGVLHPQVESRLVGLTISLTSPAGLTTTTGYDALWRKCTEKDSRGNTTTSAYVSGTVFVYTVTDATNTIVARNTYDSLGRPIYQEGAPDGPNQTSPRHHVSSSYKPTGQLWRQWGDATSPVEYGYDTTYGDRTSMSTFRGGTGWNQIHWPGTGSNTSNSPGEADSTTWGYDPATGLLAAKTDAANKTVSYTYNSAGQLATRKWSRLVPVGTNAGQPVTTTYTYDSATGEQTGISYNDGTPTLSYTYNRLGQIATIGDYVGTRTLGYDSAKPWRLATESFPAFYGDRGFTRLYESAGVIGRVHGFQLGTVPGSNSEIEETFGFSPDGRFETLTAGRNSDAVLRTFRYGYVPNSALVKSLAIEGNHPFTVTRTFEPQRDLLTSVETKWSETSRVGTVYTYNFLGQRTTATQGGDVFADYGNASTKTIFKYDAKGQLEKATSYLGTEVVEAQILHDRQHEYMYDEIGNRKSANRTGNAEFADSYTANKLNQYETKDTSHPAKENTVLTVSGTADAAASVVVTDGTSRQRADRRGNYWSTALAVGNNSGPWRGPLTVYTGKAGAGLSGADLVRTDVRLAQIAASAQNMTYDKDGNLLCDGIWNYTWDAENRLISMATTTAAAGAGFPLRELQFRYDYLGRRVQKRFYNTTINNSPVLLSGRRFLYDGWNLVAEYVDSGADAPGALVRSYVWGLDIARSLTDAGGVGALVQITDHATSKTFVPAYDGNGNILALFNADTGALAAAYEYSPYGEPLRSNVCDGVMTDQPFRFSTKFTDTETGLVYYGRRYYSPSQGRFLGRDTIEERGGRNLYAFCRNNSVNMWDLLGMLPYSIGTILRQEPVMMDRFEVRESRSGSSGFSSLAFMSGRGESSARGSEGAGSGTSTGPNQPTANSGAKGVFESINGGLRVENSSLYLSLRYTGTQALVVEMALTISWEPSADVDPNVKGGKPPTFGPIYSNVGGANGVQVTPIWADSLDPSTSAGNWLTDALSANGNSADLGNTSGTITITIRFSSSSDPATPGSNNAAAQQVFSNEIAHNKSGGTMPQGFGQSNPAALTITVSWNNGSFSAQSSVPIPAGSNRDGRESRGGLVPLQPPEPP